MVFNIFAVVELERYVESHVNFKATLYRKVSKLVDIFSHWLAPVYVAF